MKNNKGFTLVELLAVIAILAILVIIAIPNVLKMFNDSKKNAFIVQARKTANVSQGKLFTSNETTFDCNELLTGSKFKECTATVKDRKVTIDVLGSGTYENFLMIDVTSDGNSGTFVDLSKLKVIDAEKSSKDELIINVGTKEILNDKFEVQDGDSYAAFFNKVGINITSSVIESYNESKNSITVKDNKLSTTVSGEELLINYKPSNAGVYQYRNNNNMVLLVLDSMINECENSAENEDEILNCIEKKALIVNLNESVKNFEVKDNDVVHMLFKFNSTTSINNFSIEYKPFIVNGDETTYLKSKEVSSYKDSGISYNGTTLSTANNEVFEYGKIDTKEGTYKYNYVIRTKDGYEKYTREIVVLNDTSEKCFKFNNETQEIEQYYYFEDNNSNGASCPMKVVIPQKINGVQVKSIGKRAFGYECGHNIVLPTSTNNKYEIGQIGCWYKPIGITSVMIPEGLEYIGDYAFYGNRLKTVTIPNSLTYIGYSAFGYNELQSAVFKGDKNNIDIRCDAFKGEKHSDSVNAIKETHCYK